MKKFSSVTAVAIAIILAIGIAGSGLFIDCGIRYFKNFDRYVEVKGLAESQVIADRASWQIGFTTSGADLKEIYSNINREQDQVITFLINQGFNVNEIQKQPVSLFDNYANSYSNNTKVAHYTANAGVTITTNKINHVVNAVQMTNQLIEQGVLLNNNNVNYTYTGLNNIKAGMLNSALASARISAGEFATNSGSKLGKIRMASQGVFTISALDGFSGDSSSIKKVVRVVTTVQFFLK